MNFILMAAVVAMTTNVFVHAGSGSIRGLMMNDDGSNDLIALYSDLDLGTPQERNLQTPECTENDDQYELIRMTGSTLFPEGPNGIEVVSTDTTTTPHTVTIDLKQFWTASEASNSPTNTIDSIFAYYQQTTFDRKCEETTDVAEGLFDTITITCNYMSPVAYLQICVADSFRNEVLVSKDDAKIPDCCYPEFPPETGSVCYTFEISCVPKCEVGPPPTFPPISDTNTAPPTPVETKPPIVPTEEPRTETPTSSPTASPTVSPTASPTASITVSPTTSPTASPTASPIESPTGAPTASPTSSPTETPTASPTASPTSSPTDSPTESPTASPTKAPEPTIDPGNFCHALGVKHGCNLNKPGSCQIDPGPNNEPSCGVGVPEGYYPDLTNCNAYCKCTGTAAPSRYEVVNTGTYWDHKEASAPYLSGNWGKGGAWGTKGGITVHKDGGMSWEGIQRPPSCGPPQTCDGLNDNKAHPYNNCKQFFQCSKGAAAQLQNCPNGLLFNGKICDWPYNVNCRI